MRTARWRAALIAASATILVATVLVSRAEAATLFTDDFNDGNATGWSTSGGSWSVASGVLQQSSTGADAKAQAGSTSWTNYGVQARVRPNAFSSGTGRMVGLLARAQNMTNYYSLVLVGSGSLQLRRISGGGVSTLASAATAVLGSIEIPLPIQSVNRGMSATHPINVIALVATA